MKCRNFLCGNYFPKSESKTNCAGIHWWGHINSRSIFVKDCEARKRYNRVVSRRSKHSTDWLIRTERNKYHGGKAK